MLDDVAMEAPQFSDRRYAVGARWYDAVSLEWPVYRVGRQAGIELLGLVPGEHVLDVGCGTGLSLPLLHQALGPSGRVTGVDASAQMLRRARRRADRLGWDAVRLLHGDAGEPASPRWTDTAVDAVLFTYSLSVIPRWRQAFDTACAAARPGARLAVVDLALPAGPWRRLSPLARLACAAGGSDPRRHPWTLLDGVARTVEHRSARGGHIRVAVGQLP